MCILRVLHIILGSFATYLVTREKKNKIRVCLRYSLDFKSKQKQPEKFVSQVLRLLVHKKIPKKIVYFYSLNKIHQILWDRTLLVRVNPVILYLAV